MHHRRVNKLSHLKLSELVGSAEMAFDVAKEASASADKQLSGIGEKILAALAIEGITSGTGAPVQTSFEPRPTFAPAPAPPQQEVAQNMGNGRSYDREWERLETLAVDEAGPMGSQLLRKVRAKNPGVDPINLKQKVSEMLGIEMTTDIYEKYRGR